MNKQKNKGSADFYDSISVRPIEKKHVQAALSRDSLIDRKFIQYHLKNKHVWKLFVFYTRELVKRGFKHQSSDFVLHRIRWYAAVETKGDAFKLNNNYTACYARVFHEVYPEYTGFFRTRVRKSE